MLGDMERFLTRQPRPAFPLARCAAAVASRVNLISAGLDEVPMAYKDIDEVMDAQSDLVQKVARFDPRLVKMAPAGERPED